MKYTSLKKIAEHLNTRPLIALEIVLENNYHYIVTENTGMWVLTNRDNEPITCKELNRQLFAK